MDAPLDDLRVVDLSSGIAGGYVSKLLAQYGARVIHVEPPGGSELARRGPFIDGQPGPDRSLLYGWMHAGQETLEADPATEGGRAALLGLLDGADVLLDDARPGRMRALGLDFAALGARYPGLVCTSITPFGEDTPYAGWAATPAVLHALGGWVHPMGEPGRAPAVPGASLGLYMAGLFAAIGTMAALELAPGEGGQSVHVAVQEAIAATMLYDHVAYQYFGRERQRTGRRFLPTDPVQGIFPCKDGWCGIQAPMSWMWRGLCDMMGRPELVQDPRFRTPEARAENAVALEEIVAAWTSGQESEALYHAAQARRLPFHHIPTASRVYASPQLASRNYWDTLALDGRTFPVPGLPFRLEGRREGRTIAGPRPLAPGHAWAARAPLEERTPVRVVDGSMGWAGPMVGLMLALFGANVIKVESGRYFDWWRGSPHPDRQPGDLRHEMSPAHNSANRNKRGVCIDLSLPEGGALLDELLGQADAFVENYPPTVMPNLGFDPKKTCERHPRLVYLSMPAFGSTGPDALYRGFGTTVEALAGITSAQGYADGSPLLTCNAYGDPTSGLTGTFAILAGLHARRRTGRGQPVELAELEATIPHGSERLLEWPALGHDPVRYGARHPEMAPHGVYPSLPAEQGDRWVVVACRDDADWQRLRAALGKPEWAAAPQLATCAGRRAAQDLIDARLAEWTSQRTHREAMEVLQRAGVPAGAALAAPDIVDDPNLDALGFHEVTEHPVMGAAMHPGPVVKLSRTPATVHAPAPLLGQHTEEVLREVLGKGDAEIEALRAIGVLANEPARAG